MITQRPPPGHLQGWRPCGWCGKDTQYLLGFAGPDMETVLAENPRCIRCLIQFIRNLRTRGRDCPGCSALATTMAALMHDPDGTMHMVRSPTSLMHQPGCRWLEDYMGAAAFRQAFPDGIPDLGIPPPRT